ncbi:hypothetical protein EA473_21740 [Natrarchaeobius chitinivorans]|uniref:YbhB/YbcL family Raf kinase inhibitor-like protein n=1 Tax=Natrarchaeobius chitinivorans TaxID=1679083 RepID=A0A3N6LL39_NATCH|nr:hypothetical protein EA473_21740 [Natrarchaeobius chitinivorans]
MDSGIGTIPQGWDAENATEGYSDYVEQGYEGASPPEDSHDYHFKLLALDSELGTPEETRKRRLGSTIAMEAEVLAATEIIGTYDADQGTAC